MSIATTLRRAPWFTAALLLLGATVPLAGLSAQDAYPQVEVRQMVGTGVATWGTSARVSLDRDAFVVVFELGADGRARILYPARPRDDGFMRASRKWYVPLPSVDAVFIQASSMRTPTVVAFASDVAPDLSEFTENGKRWDFMFSIDDGAGREATLRDLATLIFGDPDMPYSVSESRLAPSLSLGAQQALRSCGYQVGAYGSPGFYDFLWDMFGPYYGLGYGANSPWQDVNTIAPWHTNNFIYGFYYPNLPFMRYTTGSLWNQYAGGCDGLRRFTIGSLAFLDNNRQPTPGPADTTGRLTTPRDLERRGPDGRVNGVGIVTASEAAMLGRKNGVELAATHIEGKLGSLTRETSQDMVQRQEIASVLAQLQGRVNSGTASNSRGGRFEPIGRQGSSSGYDRPTRSGSTGSSGSSSAGSSSGGSSSGSAGSAGSAGRSGESRGGAGRSSTGRGGTGKPPFQH